MYIRAYDHIWAYCGLPFPSFSRITSLFSARYVFIESLHRMERVMHLVAGGGKESMLRITTQKKRGKTVLSIEGRLAGPLVATLEQCWRELHGATLSEKLQLNLCEVSFIDAAGRML